MPPRWLEKLESRRELVYPIAVALLAALVLLPLIGSYGLWDPQEFPLADLAREVSRTGDYASVYATRPPLSVWLSAFGVSLFGPSELAVRLPHALLGIGGALATYGIGRRLRGPRTGLIAAAVLVATPLYLFQARQLNTDMGGLAGSAIAMYGLIGLAWPGLHARGPAALRYLLDGSAAALGLLLCFLGHGLVLGVGVPLAALALASTAAAAARFVDAEAVTGSASAVARTRAEALLRRRHQLVAAVAGLLAVGVFVLWYDAQDAKGYQKLLGGFFRAGAEPPATATFDYLVDQLAFGLFPWTALAPIAAVRLALPRRGDRVAWGGFVVLAWVAGAYVVGALWVREMGDIRYPGLVAVALAVGMLLDDLLAARGDAPARWPSAASGLPLLGLFALCAAVQLGRDIKEFPEELASVHLLQTIKFPAVVKLQRVLMYVGLLFGLLAAFGMSTAARPELAKREPLDRTGLHRVAIWLLDATRALADALRPLASPVMGFFRGYGLLAMIAVGVLTGLFLSLVYTPTLSGHFSYKNVFDVYFDRKQGDEPIGVMGIPGSGPDFYAHGKLERLNDLPTLTAFLRREGRVFAVAPATELCAIHQAATTTGFPYHVATAENSRFFLYTNRLGSGEHDQNPLARMISREAPTPRQTLTATFKPATAGQKGELELLGVDMPASVSKGSTFQMKLYYKVVEKPSTNYQVFVHFDKGVRFQGDHWPLGNLCGTQYWQVGDYVTDTFEVTAGEALSPKGVYEVYTGLFTGGSGNWRNMTVASGNADKNNRVRIGQITLR